MKNAVKLSIDLPVELNKTFYIVSSKSILEHKLTRKSLIEDIFKIQELFDSGLAFTNKRERL